VNPDQDDRPDIRRRTRTVPAYAGPLAAVILMCIILSVTKPFFYSSSNLLNVLSTNAPLMIVALGMTIAMIGGGFDLSVGAIVAATGIVLQAGLAHGLPAIVSVVLSLLTGVIVGGAVNGPLIAKLNLNFFVVTLGTMTSLTGIVYVVTNGATTQITSSFVNTLGNGSVLGIPVPVVLSAGCFAACLVFLKYTPLGRSVYAIGGSREVARLSGIRVPLVIILVYGITGLLASVAGLVQAGQLGAASPTVGSNLALTAGAAVLLGGTSFTGGVGGATGTVVGVLLIAVLQNGLGIYGVSSYWQNIITGVVLIGAVALDHFQRVRIRRAKAAPAKSR
jgi:ribose transport system permease protein